MKKKSIIVCTPFSNRNWTWFSSSFDKSQIQWHFYYLEPKGIIEKYIRQPNLAKIRTCHQAIVAAKEKQADLLITHDPRVTFWCAFFAKRLGVKIEHTAWSFNFPELPKGIKRTWMTKAFQNVSHFVVYSTMERHLYSEYFQIPIDRFEVNLWSVVTPKVEPKTPLQKGDYICAIGGNARDYSTLIQAIKKLPDIPLVLVTRPHNLKGLNIPPNVKTLVNIPKTEAMNILQYSRFMVLPLQGSEVPCGHVTLVAAMHLGRGFIITNSRGIDDYVFNEVNAITCPPFDPDSLAAAINHLWQNPQKARKLGEKGKEFAIKFCSEEFARKSLWNHLVSKGLLVDTEL